MNHSKTDRELSLPAMRLANVSLFCWLVAIALGGLLCYFDSYGHGLYRDMSGARDYRVEDYCLWLAAMAASIGIITSVAGLVVIRRSGGRVRGSYRLSVGIVFNLLAVLVVLFTLFLRALVNGANAV